MWTSERTTNLGEKDLFSPLFNSPSYAPTRRERRRARAQPLNPRHEFQKAVYTAHDQRVAVVRVARSGRGETATSRAYSGGSDSRVPLPDPHVYAYKRSGIKKRYTMRNKTERRVACREPKSGNLNCGNRGAWRGKIRFWIRAVWSRVGGRKCVLHGQDATRRSDSGLLKERCNARHKGNPAKIRDACASRASIWADA